MRYQSIFKQVDLIKTICSAFPMAAFRQRNEWMVDHSSRLIVIHNCNPGETRNTIEYAKRKSSKSLSMIQTVELSTQSAKMLKRLAKNFLFRLKSAKTL